MSAKLISREGKTVTLEVKFDLSGSMLEAEKSILDALNEAGCLATEEALKGFDTEGSRLVLGAEKWFSKGQVPKIYQTPYGEVEVPRHVYQRSQGGKTFCPLEREARIVVTSTPRFAQQVAHKFAGTDQIRILLLYICNRERCPEPRGSRRGLGFEERRGSLKR